MKRDLGPAGDRPAMRRLKWVLKIILLCLCPAIVLKVRQWIRSHGYFITEERHFWVRLPWGKRIWAWRHGFVSSNMLLYDFGRHKVEDYLPELPYMQAHPINGPFSCLIDNKLNLRYVLQPFSAYLPRYHLLIKRGKIIRFGDKATEVTSGRPADSIPDLCRREGRLVIKPMAGECGHGIWDVRFEEGRFVLNETVLHPDEFARRCEGLCNHVVMEHVQQHEYAVKLFPRTTNTIRVLTMWDYEQHSPFIAAAIHRVGCKSSVPVDNCTRGGLSCSLDLVTGTLGAGTQKPDQRGLVWHRTHPDTGSPIQGVTIPHWEEVKSGILAMARYLALVPYMGWDIAVTQAGLKVIEINSLSSVGLIQVHGPFLADPRVRRFFEAHIPRLKAFTSRPERNRIRYGGR